MKDTDFLDVSSYIRVLEKRMLSTAAMNRIIEASDPQETLRLLGQESEYDFAPVKQPEDYESVLSPVLTGLYEQMYAISPCPEVVDIAACKYDFHNLKVALKAGRTPSSGYRPYTDAGRFSAEDIAGAVGLASDDDKKPAGEIPAHLSEAALAAAAAFEQSGNPQDIDVLLDKRMLAHMLSLAEGLGNEFITEYVRLVIDFYNIKAFLRTRETRRGTSFLSSVLVPGGLIPESFFVGHYGSSPETLSSAFHFRYMGEAFKAGMAEYLRSGDYAELERLLDNMLLTHLKKSKLVPFGAEIMLSYILSKENEIRQIRIIMTCKLNGISPETLRERLRDNYV